MTRHKQWINRIKGMIAVLVMALVFAVPSGFASFADAEVTVPVKISFTGNSLPTETFTVEITDIYSGKSINGSAALSAGNKSEQIQLELGTLSQGTHVYVLRQQKGSNPDIEYSDSTYTYYIDIKDDGTVDQVAVNDKEPTDKPEIVEFNNRYRPGSSEGGDEDSDKDTDPDGGDEDGDGDGTPGDDEVIGDPPVRVRKDVSGKKPPKVDRFVFVMVPENPDYPLPDVEAQGSGVTRKGYVEVYLNGIGEVEIGNITFREEGVYKYFVHEKDTAIDGYNYDEARFTVTYVVARDQEGKLTCDRTITMKGEGQITECSFDNIYDPNPVTRKLRRSVKTGDPAVMWPLTLLCVAVMILIALLIDRRNRREARRGK